VTRLGRYELGARLGRGGMGEVFLSRTESGQPVVVKRLAAHLASDRALVDRFLHEAALTARLAHPNVARVLDFGEHGGSFFLVLELVDGRSLEGGPPLEPGHAALLVLDAARGLAAAHEFRDASGLRQPIIHGDVSPRNLLLGRDGVVRLIDFGLAHLRAARADDSSGGTFEYLAPEQALDGVTDERTDQFSLGVVAWELLTGRALFGGDTDTVTLDQVLACEITPPRALRPSVPPALEAVVLRMLEKAPALRFPSMRDVAQALTEFVDEGARAQLRASGSPPGPASRRATEAAVMTPQPPPVSLTELEHAALARLRPPLTLDELEAAVGLDVAQALVDAGALVRGDDGLFRRAD
jgi:serine/threonine-protein kinase